MNPGQKNYWVNQKQNYDTVMKQDFINNIRKYGIYAVAK